jgi:hypothetical protein
MTALQLVEGYYKGIYARGEVYSRLLDDFSLADIRSLPQEWQDGCLERLAKAPRTDEEWAKVIYVFSWCGVGSPPTQEELRAKGKIRVELLRKELEAEQGGGKNERR